MIEGERLSFVGGVLYPDDARFIAVERMLYHIKPESFTMQTGTFELYP